MPKGIRGSGPYSKVNADGTPKEATATNAAGSRKPRKPRKVTARKVTARKTTARKATTRRRANGHTSVTDLGQFRSVSVTADGQIVLEGRTGKKVTAKLDRPSMLLDLAEDANAAVDEFLANR